jgi:sugar lactone lactonase YvrE
MNIIKEFKWFKLGQVGLIVALLCVCSWAEAKAPFDDFPDFISFTGDLAVSKMGDVAFDKTGNVYVNVSVDGGVYVWEFSPDGDQLISTYISEGLGYGLTLDEKGDIYVAVTGEEGGVYRLDRRGNVVLLPGTDQIVLPNALAFDQRGNLYVTESFSVTPEGDYDQGGIWRIPHRGEAELLLRDVLLTGTGAALGYPFGANGIACYHSDLYVANFDKGLILQIPIKRNGDLGQPEIWKELEVVPESLPALSGYPVMGDGIAIDEFGNIYVAILTKCAVVRINAKDLSQETVAAFGLDNTDPLYAPLDFPNSVAFGPGMGWRKNLMVTNFGMLPGLWPGRGLVKIEIDEPGRPCHKVFRGYLPRMHLGKWFPMK